MSIFMRRGPGGAPTGRRRGRLVIAALMVGFALISYFALPKVTNPETGESYRRAMSVDQQKALGLEAAKQMIPQMGGAADPDRDPDAALVRQVGGRIVQQTGAQTTPFADSFQFWLIEDPSTINAFALPGGQVSITRGLYNRLENEAQLAGVLGHEVGHVIAEHSAQQMAKGQLGQMIVGAVAVGASDEQGRGQSAAAAAAMANQMIQLSYGRDDERQSDDIGLRYMTQAGYDPHGMLGVMQVLKEAAGSGRQPEFLSSHPHPETRLETIQKYLEENRDELSRMTLTTGRTLRGG
jgi:predicted Zn-dependent protease